jgi:hypothetical protein
MFKKCIGIYQFQLYLQKYIIIIIIIVASLGSAVGIATFYGLDDPGAGVRVSVVLRILTSPYRPDRLKGPPSLLANGSLWLFPWG